MEGFLPKTDSYRLFLVSCIAAFFAWGVILYFRPLITEAGCSELAERSSKVYLKEKTYIDPDLNYDTLKSKCMEDAYKNTK